MWEDVGSVVPECIWCEDCNEGRWVAIVVVLCGGIGGGIGGGIAWHWLWVQCNVLDRQQKEQKTLVCCKVAVGPFFI